MATAIVVPVFKAHQETARCLSALKSTVTADQASVVIIDDASADSAINALLEEVPPEWVIVRNLQNLGFVATANLGMSLAGRADVVLLNSDSQVCSGWLESILDCAETDPAIASITPLTNHGEIASLPEFCRPNPWPECADLWSQAARESGPATYPEIPTAVGFCMYLRRSAIDQIGGFDELAFGRGYGEENDWCCRATAAGWRHVLCDHAFVAHQGGASFSPLGLAPGGQAMQTLLARHPDYMDRVRTFIEADPFGGRRRQIVEHYKELSGRLSA